MTEGPFTDEHARHWMTAVQTHDGIIKYAEAMAQVLAEAGRASQKVTGDSPSYAVRRWTAVIMTRALELLEQDHNPLRERMRAELKRLGDKRQ